MESFKIIQTILLSMIVLLIIFIIYTIIKPKIIMKYIISTFHIQGNPDSLIDNIETETFTTSIKIKNKYKIFTKHIYYYSKQENDKTTIIIDLPGGAFLVSANTMVHYKAMENLKYDVVSIEYPVLLEAKATYIISYIENAIQHIIDKYKKKYNLDHLKIILSTASAGSYYGVKIINNNQFNNNIYKFTAVSGYFGYTTFDNIFAIITDKLYLNSLKNNTKYICNPIPSSKILTFFAISDKDLLSESTIKYLSKTGQVNEIITYPSSDHCFYLHVNSLDTQKYYKDYISFINS
uniref:BD-FAE-like domain-containing protein n=1 Tax=Faxonius propinquus nudivirus TaxID=3139431 RepID=A0AAU8GF89_9VIRU